MTKATAALLVCVLLSLRDFCLAQGLPQKPVEGNKYTYEFSQFSTAVTQVPGRAARKSEHETSYVASLEIGARDAEGNVPHQITFNQIRFRSAEEGQDVVNFDSQVNLATTISRNQQFYLDTLRPLVGARYTVLIDPKRHVMAVEGTEEIIKQAVSRGTTVWLTNEFEFNRLKKRFEQELARFPAADIKQGDTWQGTDHVDCFVCSGMLIEVERRYEHLGTEQRGGRTLDKIGTTDLLIIDAGNIDWKLVESKGTILFDRERGLEVESTSNLRMKAVVTLRMSGLQDHREVRIETTRKLRE